MKAMLFEKLIDRKDRRKIRKRTRIYNSDYDYRLQLPAPHNPDKISFMALGDSGSGDEQSPMKYHIADQMLALDQANPQDLILHTGDLVYLSGSKQGYPLRFIETYKHWLLRGNRHRYNDMVFTKPFLPIYGNHDYYDFSKILPGVGKLLGLLHGAIGTGSKTGRIFDEAFILPAGQNIEGSALAYKPSVQTRIPNRYYWYTLGPCAFFALDSNTLDIIHAPTEIEKQQIKADIEKIEDEIESGRRGLQHFKELEERGEMTEPLRKSFEVFFYQLAEREKKAALLKKRLDANEKDHDVNQLAWLDKVLGKEEVKDKWKIVYLHHSPYSSEAGHVDDIATGGLRENLRRIFIKHGVHLVLSGHSHCFEWTQNKTANQHASDELKDLAEMERNTCYLVTGGGGRGLRESIFEGFIADEQVRKKQKMFSKAAESKAYTAIFDLLDTPDQITDVYNFLHIEADKEKLIVYPKGVTLKDGRPYLLPDFYTKVFSKKEGFVTREIKILRSITISKGNLPVGEWDEIVS